LAITGQDVVTVGCKSLSAHVQQDISNLAFSYYLHQKLFNLASVIGRTFFKSPAIANALTFAVIFKDQTQTTCL